MSLVPLGAMLGLKVAQREMVKATVVHSIHLNRLPGFSVG